MSQITESLLDNLRYVESRGNRYAVNPKTQAVGPYQFLPSTVEMLRKQGYSFDPFDEKESRAAASFYLNQLLTKHKGDLDKALANYGGHISKPDGPVARNYIAQVKGGDHSAAKGDGMENSFSSMVLGGVDQGAKSNVERGFAEMVRSGLESQASIPEVITPETRAEEAALRAEQKGKKKPFWDNRGLSWWDTTKNLTKGVGGTVLGVGEAALTTATAGIGALAAPVIASGDVIFANKSGEQARRDAIKAAGSFTYDPRTQVGQGIVDLLSKGIEKAKIPPYVPIIGNINQAITGRGINKLRRDNLLTPGAQQATPSAGFQPQGGSAGAAGVSIQSRIQESLSRASQDTLNKVMDKPIKDIDYRAIDRQNLADKFKYRLTEGQSKGNTNLRSEEYNLAPQEPALQSRLYKERQESLDYGFTKFRDDHTPDIAGIPNAHNGQILIDDIQTRMKPILDDERAKWDATKQVFGNELEYDNQALAISIDKDLKLKGLTHFVPAEVKAMMRDFTEAKKSTFDEYDAIRTVLAKIQRSSPDTNARQSAFIIHNKLNNLEIKTDNPKAKQILDAARKATREKYAFLERNPLIKTAIDDPRTAEEIANGVLHPAADNIIARNILGTSDKASTAQTQHLVKFLQTDADQFGDRGLQALRASVFNEFDRKGRGASGTNEIFKTQAFIDAVDNPQFNAKYQTIFTGNQLNDIADIAKFARDTEPVPKGGHANVSGTLRGDIGRYAQNVAEQTINYKTFGIGGKIISSQWARAITSRRINRALNPTFTYKDINIKEQ